MTALDAILGPLRFDRTTLVIVVAHPDDEVIGAGAQLRGWTDRCRIVHVTDGSPRNMRDAIDAGCASREAYGRARRAELEAALGCAAIEPEQCREVGLVDQEASHDMALLARRLAAMLYDERAGVVLTHPYEGGHPDHDATAFAVHAATRLLARDRGSAPCIVEMTSYHAGPGGVIPGLFLDAAGPIATVHLTDAEQALKRRMFRCFVTQRQVLRAFPVTCERFRRAPQYRFDLPPHEGLLWYERFPWGMQGARWRRLAADALARLNLEPSCR